VDRCIAAAFCARPTRTNPLLCAQSLRRPCQGRVKAPVPAALANKTRDELLGMLLDALKKLKQRDRRIEGARC
jgi:hypothetical protein